MRGSSLASRHWLIDTESQSLGRIRGTVHRTLVAAGVDVECRERVVVAADELVVNAAQHAPGTAVLSVCITPDLVRVAVADGSALGLGARWRRTRTSGLTLVTQLGLGVSVRPSGDGKVVETEIVRRAAERRDDDPDGFAEALGDLL